jgi:transposase
MKILTILGARPQFIKAGSVSREIAKVANSGCEANFPRKENLIPIISTNLALNDFEIINIYKKRWNIEQGYKDLREYFQFGKEENRIYEALIARITLSFLAYNLTSYINRIHNEPQTLGNLFRDLECQLETLAISMEFFLKILEQMTYSPTQGSGYLYHKSNFSCP